MLRPKTPRLCTKAGNRRVSASPDNISNSKVFPHTPDVGQGLPATTPGSINKGTFSRFPRSSAKQPATPPRGASGRLPAILSPSRPPHLRCPGSSQLPSSPGSPTHPASPPLPNTPPAHPGLPARRRHTRSPSSTAPVPRQGH